MDKDLYNDEFLGATLFTLGSQIEDLEKYSVHNGDIELDSIIELRRQFETLEQKVQKAMAIEAIAGGDSNARPEGWSGLDELGDTCADYADDLDF